MKGSSILIEFKCPKCNSINFTIHDTLDYIHVDCLDCSFNELVKKEYDEEMKKRLKDEGVF